MIRPVATPTNCRSDMSTAPPQAVWSGSFRIFGVEVKCHVLDDGRRIIEADSMDQLLGAITAPGSDLTDEDREALAGFLDWQHGRDAA
jgi:hypothetical protein